MATSRQKDQPEGAGKQDKASPESLPANEEGPGADQVNEVVDTETERGFRGVEVDITPNEAYTVPGVVAGQPTPETDAKAADEAAAHARDIAGPGNDRGPR